jgi:16S rRNA (guanine527-N7)-methyltransferase
MAPRWRDLLSLLSAARDQHFLGPGAVGAHLEHSLAFAAFVPEAPARAIDLGSGAGIPGLVLALQWPGSVWALVEANVRRSGFLREAVSALQLDDRVEVVTQRAEVVARDPLWRASADLVVARGFGPPAVVAECAAPMLRPGGLLVVAEPPGGAPDRWPAQGLAVVGLASDQWVAEPVALHRLRQVEPCPDRYPRRVGIPLKRPLW